LFFEIKANIGVEKNTLFYYQSQTLDAVEKDIDKPSETIIRADNLALHEFHICKSDINYDTKSQTLQLTLHIYIDDLERALVVQGKKNTYIGSAKENQKTDEWVSQYLSSKFIITIDKQKSSPTFIGKELSEDKTALYCYFEIPVTSSAPQLTICNSILHEIFNDQKNIVKITKNKKRISEFLFDDAMDVEKVSL
jgi:hypothetical protein